MAKLLSDFGGSWEDLLGPFVFGYNMTPHSSTKVEPYVAMFGREGRRPSESVFARQRTTYTWALDCWIEQLPEHLRKVWDVMKTNTEEAKAQFAKQYDRTKEDPKLREGDSVLWFRPQDVQGDRRKSAMPYIGPYTILKIGSKNTAEIRLRNNSEAEIIKVNIDQLSKCYPEFADQSEITGKKIRQRYANHPRKEGATLIWNVEHAAKNYITSDTSTTQQKDEMSSLSEHLCAVNVFCDLKETEMATMER
ncbi:MAG: hypothetical protein GY816_15535, partial [Cytophagales bacterium]|nr:hypothetical protein [Cytophagales bacterium]